MERPLQFAASLLISLRSIASLSSASPASDRRLVLTFRAGNVQDRRGLREQSERRREGQDLLRRMGLPEMSRTLTFIDGLRDSRLR